MFKTTIISSLLICISSATFAELSVSEKVRPQISSLVNPNIQRLDIPPTPNNMSLPSFGQAVIGWGTGPDGAEKRLNNITKDDIEKLKTQNVTLEMIQTWQKFYENETNRNTGNPTAPLRAKLMKKIIELW
ncbi:DUF4951 domain-containing protein [Acinetobacter faecalis]|uniref:DUF4951 domain-containing protein n=1 Tax=Acinetobacter faecalis TaxID=2665161 RepID=UPI002A9100F4|nr:DUF4951 domain-containing protein [Acinetobacter faecalis]MDY6451154.1 DUF4951 domain-containing protein [Acinetobacter faecalis]